MIFYGDIADEVTVFFPGRNSSNIMHFLAEIPNDVIRKKQKAIEKYASIMQYSLPPANIVGKCLGHAGSAGREQGCVWSPPAPDVVDVMLSGLSTIIRRLRNYFTSLYLDCYY
jgi:hypothetical protein